MGLGKLHLELDPARRIRYFEDFPLGETIELGSHQFTRESIVAFGTAFDPQVYHVDPARARTSIWGGLIASGWQTASVYMRLLVDNLMGATESLGSPGLDSLKWLRPVREGDTLRARITFLETTPSRSRPDRGIVRSRGEMVNQDGEVVMQLEAINFYGRRPPAGAPPLRD
ncbi:MAG TPA: MaoC family dehydratase [Chloroflexota bacterium]|nr:MaoC family dehydratase [Chloroflexota bacterium]